MASDLLALLDTLDGLHKATNLGTIRRDGNHRAKIRGADGDTFARVVPESSEDPWSPTDEQRAECIIALHNAYPHLAQALRTTLTPTTDGEREAREALFFADRDHAAGFRCVPEPIHRALSTALNLLAAERAKAADAARERAAIVADLRAGAEIVRGLSLDVGPVMADTLIAAALRYESGAHTKVTP